MTTSDRTLLLWTGNQPARIPAGAVSAKDIVPVARQLTSRDRDQIVSAFKSGHYEMVATFVWNKALTSLKAQLGKLGASFISEMLDRPDIDEASTIEQKLTDYEALRLAQELGIVRGTGAFRLRQAFERITHFGSLPAEEAEEVEFTCEEAIGVLRACTENILGFERIEEALDFKRFRDSLSEEILHASDEIIAKLLGSPYFFHRACVRMLLSLIKSENGAQLETALANGNVIVPQIWPSLLKPERFQVGRAYSELIADGRSLAASGVRKILLKVKGFAFVPEDLRSTAFTKAAHNILAAHEAMNNFYNEPAPMRILEKMGTVIPVPAFPICMTAVLSVRLGNSYGVSYDAQAPAAALLRRISSDRWAYYLNECLPADETILYKLLTDRPSVRWGKVVDEFSVVDCVSDLRNSDLKNIVTLAASPDSSRFRSSVRRLLSKLGYEDS